MIAKRIHAAVPEPDVFAIVLPAAFASAVSHPPAGPAGDWDGDWDAVGALAVA